MRILALFTILLGAVAAVPTENLHPLSDEFIAEINKKATTWVAGRNFDISQYERVKRISNGVFKRKKSPGNGTSIIRNQYNDVEIPESFDAREQWPNCESIREIRDQSNCGSCWAVAAASAMSDRICIASNQTKQTRVSFEDLNSCCFSCGGGDGYGCDGGYTIEAWEYWAENGIVTGGLYKANQGCKDYTLEPCEHDVEGSRPQCSSLNYMTPACKSQCQDSSMDYSESKTYGQAVIYCAGEELMQRELMTNGPIEVDFRVHTDFPSYKSGIYQPTAVEVLGGHAVKLIGWGVENNVKYWLLANSWNEDWGDKGYFKMLRGIGNCGIEDDAVASLPK